MKVSLRHIGLIAGILSVLTSFLFFGRKQGTYQVMFLAGLLVSFLFFLWIIFGRRTGKSKLLWTAVVFLGVALSWLTESFFIDTSYRIYISKFEQELGVTNDILKSKSDEIWIMRDSITAKDGANLTLSEKQRLMEAKNKLGAYMILKNDSTIYYGLWGFLDVRLGITFAISGRKPGDQYQHLTGNWFH
jgi:hypothetical protein